MTDEPLLIDARLHLLGRQVHDKDDVPVCVIDDVELTIGDDDTPVDPGEHTVVVDGPAKVHALLSDRSLLTRIFGGRLPSSLRHRIAWTDVGRIGLVITLDRSGEGLDQTYGERWMRDHVIGRIPGAHHSAE